MKLVYNNYIIIIMFDHVTNIDYTHTYPHTYPCTHMDPQNLTDQLTAVEEAHSKLKQFFQEQQHQASSFSTLQHSHKETESELAVERKTTEKLKSELASLHEKLESGQVSCTNMQTRITQLKEENKALKKGQNEADEREMTLRKELEEMRNNHSSALETLKSRVTTLQKEKDGLASQVNGLQEQLKTSHGDISVKTEAVKKLELEIAEEKSQHTKLEDLLRSVEGELQTLKSDNEQLNVSCEASKKESKIVEELQVRVDELNSEKSSLEAQVQNLESKIQNQSSMLESSRQQNAELKQAVETECGKSLTLNNQVSEMSSKLADLELKVEDMHTERDSLQTNLNEMQSKWNEAIKEKEAVCGNAKSREVELNELKTKGQEYVEEILAITTEGDKLKARVSDLQQELCATKARNKTLLNENKTLHSSKDQTDGEQSHFESLCKTLQDTEVDLRQQVAGLKTEVEETKQEKDSANQTFEQQIGVLKTAVEKATTEKESVKQSLEQQLADLSRQIEEAMTEKDSLKQKLDQQGASHKEESKKLKAFIMKIKKELSEFRERVSVTHSGCQTCPMIHMLILSNIPSHSAL